MDVRLRPIGVVAAKGRFNDDYSERLDSLVQALRERAPEGTARMYNLQYELCDYHCHYYFRGTADCFADEFVEIGEGRAPRKVRIRQDA